MLLSCGKRTKEKMELRLWVSSRREERETRDGNEGLAALCVGEAKEMRGKVNNGLFFFFLLLLLWTQVREKHKLALMIYFASGERDGSGHVGNERNWVIFCNSKVLYFVWVFWWIFGCEIK